MTTTEEFLREALKYAPPDACVWITQFSSAPNDDSANPKRWTGNAHKLDALPYINGANAYYSTAAFPADAPTRDSTTSLGTFAIVADDVGTKVQPDFVRSKLGEPSAQVETSPGNEQWVYFLDKLYQYDEVTPANDRLKELKLSDTSGVNAVRYVRLPTGINNKTSLATPHAVHLVEWHPELRHNLSTIAERLGIDSTAKKPKKKYELPQVIEEGCRDEEIAKYCLSLCNKNLSEGEIEALALTANCDRCVPPLPESDVRNKVKYALKKYAKKRKSTPVANGGPIAEILELQQMVERFVWVAREPIIVDLHNIATKWRPHAFHGKYAASKVPSGEKKVAVSKIWAMDPNRQDAYDLSFDPSEPRFFRRDGGPILFNQWAEPTWPDADISLAAPFLQHLEFLVPDEKQRSDCLDWLAAAAQQPGIRPHYHFLMLAERQGIGRSWLGDVLRELWTNEYAAQVDLHALLQDNFNSELSRKIIVYVNEAKAPADVRFAHRERLKSLLTNTSLTVNEKHLARWTEKFCARLLMFTNSTNALPITETDRRVYVIRNPSTPREPEYYSQLYGRLADKQFLAAVWKFLKTRDLSNYNPGAVAPLTFAKREMAEDGRTADQQAAVEFAQKAPFDVIHAPDLYQVVAPPDEYETAKDRDKRIRAIRYALQGVGLKTAERQLRPVVTTAQGDSVGAAQRVWILKNPEEWEGADTIKLRDGVARARAELDKHGWKLDRILGAWGKDDTGPSTKRDY